MFKCTTTFQALLSCSDDDHFRGLNLKWVVKRNLLIIAKALRIIALESFSEYDLVSLLKQPQPLQILMYSHIY
jgi:hypothetical protein